MVESVPQTTVSEKSERWGTTLKRKGMGKYLSLSVKARFIILVCACINTFSVLSFFFLFFSFFNSSPSLRSVVVSLYLLDFLSFGGFCCLFLLLLRVGGWVLVLVWVGGWVLVCVWMGGGC